MNIITGTGQSSWAPQRVTLEAYQNLPPTLAETLTSEVIGGQFVYGPLGGCQGSTPMLAGDAPAGWRTARSRLLRTKLESEHGTGYVHAALLDQPRESPGALSSIATLPPHTLFADTPGAGMIWGGLTPGARNFGIYAPFGPASQTLQDALNTALEPWPNSEFAIGPDLYSVLGRPESASFIDLDLGALDGAAYQIENLGLTIPPYTTSGVLDPGEGWQKYVYFRQNVPDLVPRRNGQATANPLTVKNPAALNVALLEGTFRPVGTDISYLYSYWGAGQLASTSYRWEWALAVPSDTPSARYRTGSVTLGVNITGVEQQTVDGQDSTDAGGEITLRLYEGNTLLAEGKLTPKLGTFGVFSVELPIPDSKVGVPLFAQVSLNLRHSHKITMTVLAATAAAVVETPNTSGVIMPAGYLAPFEVGPVYRIRLPGWHVPPFRIIFPWGLVQFAAGAVVTWNRNEAFTDITTAAWPYPGQKRSA